MEARKGQSEYEGKDPPKSSDRASFVREKEAIISQLSEQEGIYQRPDYSSFSREKEAIVKQLEEMEEPCRNNRTILPRNLYPSTNNNQLPSNQISKGSNISGVQEGGRRPGAYTVLTRAYGRRTRRNNQQSVGNTNNETPQVDAPPEDEVITADVVTILVEFEEDQKNGCQKKWIAITSVIVALSIIAIGLGVGLFLKTDGNNDKAETMSCNFTEIGHLPIAWKSCLCNNNNNKANIPEIHLSKYTVVVKLFSFVVIINVWVTRFLGVVLEVSSKNAFEAIYILIIDLFVGLWCFDAEFRI